MKDPSLPSLLLGDCLHRHFSPTVFDSKVPWRLPPAHFHDNTSMLYPSERFLSSTPDGRLPSVGDWFNARYMADPKLRRRNWSAAYDLS
ncbi:hypothetical protein HK101_008027, partial [Irineochytrium annulatum]